LNGFGLVWPLPLLSLFYKLLCSLKGFWGVDRYFPLVVFGGVILDQDITMDSLCLIDGIRLEEGE